MRAIILAAGIGSRLRPMTDAIPKCLVPVAGRPILGWQIDALRHAGVDQVIVAAGYRADDVVAFCRPLGESVSVVVNPMYDRTNNMFSLRLALQGREDIPAVICNGDVVFDAEIPASMVRRPADEDGLIAVEPGRYIEESMKVTVDTGGRVTAISKAIGPAAAYGVSIDLYRFSGAALAALCRVSDRLIEDAASTNLWTEVAIDAVLPELTVRAFDIGRSRWIEIDNVDDLAEGQRLFSTPVQ